MTGIATALAKAQASMGRAIKQTANPHFRAMYADLGAVMDACLPALNEAGIALVQPTGEDENGRYVETVLIHGESGERLSCRVPLIIGKNDMQGYGSAVTYARRYGLMAMAAIAPEDDDGNAASRPAARQNAETSDQKTAAVNAEAIQKATGYLDEADSLDDLKARWERIPAPVRATADVQKAKDEAKDRLSKAAAKMPDDLGGDDLPY